MTISSGNITDEIIQKYIEDQEGDPVEIGQFEIDSTLIPPQLRAYGCSIKPVNDANVTAKSTSSNIFPVRLILYSLNEIFLTTSK